MSEAPVEHVKGQQVFDLDLDIDLTCAVCGAGPDDVCGFDDQDRPWLHLDLSQKSG